MRLRRTLGLFAMQTALFVLMILAVCAATPVHIALLNAFDAAQRTGYAQSEIAEIAGAMANVLRGADRQILAKWFTADEVLHMQDVQWLFGVGIKLFAGLSAGSLLFLWTSRKISRRENAVCARWAIALSVLLPAAIAVPFIVDFTGMFIWLHRVAFPGNELWLMNPAIHKMVVVYNEEFFIAAVVLIGALCAVSLLPMAVMCRRTEEKK